MDARGLVLMGAAESGCWWSLKVSELSDTSRIPVAFAGVVLVSGAALCPFTADCIQQPLSPPCHKQDGSMFHKSLWQPTSNWLIVLPNFVKLRLAEDIK